MWMLRWPPLSPFIQSENPVGWSSSVSPRWEHPQVSPEVSSGPFSVDSKHGLHKSSELINVFFDIKILIFFPILLTKTKAELFPFWRSQSILMFPWE